MEAVSVISGPAEQQIRLLDRVRDSLTGWKEFAAGDGFTAVLNPI